MSVGTRCGCVEIDCNRCPSPWLLLDSLVQKKVLYGEGECFCSLVGGVLNRS